MLCESLTMILVVAWAPTTELGLDIVSKIGIPMILGSVCIGFIVMLVASPDVWNVLGHLWQRLKGCVGRGRKQEGAAE